MLLDKQTIMDMKDRIQADPEWIKWNARLEEKRKIAIEYMGKKWILHKDNHVQRKPNK